MLSGTRASIAVKIFGDDLLTLRRLGEQVRDVMTQVPGAADVSLEQQTEIAGRRFVLNRPRLRGMGCGPATSLRAVERASLAQRSVASSTGPPRSIWW